MVATNRFLAQAVKLPAPIYEQLKKRLEHLGQNPRHPSLQTHVIKHAQGDFGGKLFEAYINIHYRFTWEYGAQKGVIILRNADNHDACLKRP